MLYTSTSVVYITWFFKVVENNVSCPQFSDWSVFRVGFFGWWEILGRYMSSSGIEMSLSIAPCFCNVALWKCGACYVSFFWRTTHRKKMWLALCPPTPNTASTSMRRRLCIDERGGTRRMAILSTSISWTFLGAAGPSMEIDPRLLRC